MGLRPTHGDENWIGVGGTINAAWTAKVVCTLDKSKPWRSLIWSARF